MPTSVVGAGEAAEIATGAPMPEGADAVVMVEETERADADDVRVLTPVYPRQNVGRQGADIVHGQAVLRRGDVLNRQPDRRDRGARPDRTIDVYQRALASRSSRPATRSSTPGEPLAPGQIYDINRFTLSAIIAEHGGVPVAYQTAQDTIEDLERADRRLPRARTCWCFPAGARSANAT